MDEHHHLLKFLSNAGYTLLVWLAIFWGVMMILIWVAAVTMFVYALIMGHKQ